MQVLQHAALCPAIRGVDGVSGSACVTRVSAAVAAVGGRAGGVHGAPGRRDGGGDRAPPPALRAQAPPHPRRHLAQAEAPAELLAATL
ncbi:jg11029 [Pararge aegeria aegeria]|uniref:Jg11029 protein n=1 Tax=Pararge aegeria aegeria TaxID=348720 RepID=A0A8S4S6R7_9NEOP|nr:jg11029 [Pararge aegeria aegeria]